MKKNGRIEIRMPRKKGRKEGRKEIMKEGRKKGRKTNLRLLRPCVDED